MKSSLLGILAVAVAAGCGGATAPFGNKVLNPPAEDKNSAERILREHGVDKPVIALQDRGEFWAATVSTSNEPKADSQGTVSMSPPALYQVFKDGRVVDSRNNIPLKKK